MIDTTTHDARPAARPMVRIGELEVCGLPAGHEAYPVYVLRIRPLAGGWAVVRAGDRCLGRDGTWAYGSNQGDRDDAWLAEHRFSLKEALEQAEESAQRLTVRGRTAAQLLAEEDDQADLGGEATAAAAELAQAWTFARSTTPDEGHYPSASCT
ncbi:hypothetical protein ACPCBF_24890 [Streptomyces pseudogriseolus]|uniref:hypothetical protein n=1 Tax=Streptomyces pseudogriseolus TaxID=36817 RepID=UPI003FA28162